MSVKKIVILSLASIFVIANLAFATERDQAKKLYSSLTGNTPNKSQADQYELMLKNNGASATALNIIEANKGFYNVTLKNFFTPMTNEDGTGFESLNDMSALLIGATRDDINFFRVFYDDIMYQFDGILITLSNISLGLVPNTSEYITKAQTQDWYYMSDLGTSVRMYNRTKNDMYAQAEAGNVPMGNKKYFKMTQQQAYTTKDPAAIAGIFSTRAWAKAYYVAGTNRASFAYFAKNFMCKEMEELSDTTIPDFRVRRDVDRTPGGSSKTYKTFCVGCHAGQDALGGAFAYYDYVDGTMVYASHDIITPQGEAAVVGPVAPKINANNLFTDGKITSSDSWLNLWNEGQNAYVGWGANLSGNGAKTLGKMLSETKQVRKCLSEKVFESVCFRKPTSDNDKKTVAGLATKFDQDGSMKSLWIGAAVACMGE